MTSSRRSRPATSRRRTPPRRSSRRRRRSGPAADGQPASGGGSSVRRHRGQEGAMAGRDTAIGIPQAGRRAGGDPKSRAGVRAGGSTLKRDLTGWAFALPFVLIFAIFLLGPVIASLLLSMTNFGLRDLRNPLGVSFTGLSNYAALLAEGRFWTSPCNTAYSVVGGLPLTLVLGLGAALALDGGTGKCRTLFRVGYCLPVVTSIVAIAVVWRFVL